MQGWISIHRQIRDHWIFSDPEYLRAWLIILMEVAHAPGRVLIKGRLLEFERGESLRSLESWGTLFGSWGKKRVQRFFALLQKEGMICTSSVTVSTRLKVQNYDRYQQPCHGIGSTEEPTEAPQRHRTGTPDNNGNNGNNGNKEHNEGELSPQETPPPPGAHPPIWDELLTQFAHRLSQLKVDTVRQLGVDLSSEDFSGVDVPAQLRAAARWERKNPTRKKTARGLPRFLLSWVERQQNEGGPRAPSGGAPAVGWESPAERSIRQSQQALAAFSEEGNNE